MSRVAVLGVPRGGTTLTVGLLRILGYRLPDVEPCCLHGESRRLRATDSPLASDLPRLAAEVDALPDGVVWKDPSVGRYAHLIDWSGWLTVRVRRPLDAVLASEERWIPGRDQEALAEQATAWDCALDLIPAQIHLSAEMIRAHPIQQLQRLAGVTRLMTMQISRAEDFIRPAGGYHCPLPVTCILPETAHML